MSIFPSFTPMWWACTSGVLGFLLLAVRLFDAVTDPLLGYLTDNTRTPFGRRRPYIALGSLALAVSLYLLFNPPTKASPTFETWWFGICIFSLFLFWTTVVVPYESWDRNSPLTTMSGPASSA
jgi:glycoside/pentoside/hexuronide:cation symporter, GPH family